MEPIGGSYWIIKQQQDVILHTITSLHTKLYKDDTKTNLQLDKNSFKKKTRK